MSDEAFLGVYEDSKEIKIIINREILEDCANYMNNGKQITINDAQFAVIVKKVYEAGLASAFIESVLNIVEEG